MARRRRRGARFQPPSSQQASQEGQREIWLAVPIVLVRFLHIVVLAALIGLSTHLFASATFYVSDVEVVGAHFLSADDIKGAAGVDRRNIFSIRPERVADRIIHMGGVQSVHVRCSLPAKVSIEIEERIPVVLWRLLAQKKDWWLDEDGVVVPYHGDTHSDSTLFVVDSSERTLDLGDSIEPYGIVDSVRQLAEILPGVRVFYFDSGRGLTYVQQGRHGQWTVLVGGGDNLEQKMQVARVLSEYFDASGIQPSYVDVRWPERPAYGKLESKRPGSGD